MSVIVLLSLILSLITLPVTLYLGVLATLAWRFKKKEYRTPVTRFVVIVPAHNEQDNIQTTVRSLASLDYPSRLCRVVVVADNCTDDTAAIARAAGAEVLERTDRKNRGKGFALNHAFNKLLGRRPFDAAVVVDADTVVSENLLRAFDLRLRSGAHAVQAEYGVQNVHASWRTRLMAIALGMFHRTRSLARERMGVSVGLRGNGMCFSADLIKRHPHRAFSVVEDVEYGIDIGLADERVAFAEDAYVLGEMVSTAESSVSQRQRWEGGRWAIAKKYAPTLLREAVRRRSPLLWDLLADLLVPPLSYVAIAVFVGMILELLLALFGNPVSLSFYLWTVSLIGLILYGVRGMQHSGLGIQAIATLLYAPYYIIWKILVAGPMKRQGTKQWVRTARENAEQPRSENENRTSFPVEKMRRLVRPLSNWLLGIVVVVTTLLAIYVGLKESRTEPDNIPAAGTVQKAVHPVSMRVYCGEPSHQISQSIYGIAYVPRKAHAEDHFWQMNPGARRWGGNATSRFNWKVGNAWNAGRDWFFKNLNYSIDPNYHWFRFLKENTERGVATALTVPLLGWVAKDTKSFSFPVSSFGPQEATAPETPDAGNGKRANGSLIRPPDPEATSVRMSAAAVGEWVAAIHKRSVQDGKRLVHTYILGNEPMLWHDTHRDVRKSPLGYDELLERTLTYGSAVRKADPEATIAGPAVWGWPAYFYSAKDLKAGLRLRPDRKAHHNIPLLAWYLSRLKRHEQRTGERILDVLDVHFYPQGKNIYSPYSADVSPEVSSLRIRSTRSLWDPTYRDESWIDATIRLLPRLQELVQTNYPELKISIGEYSFGAEEHISGGMALAEALGRFGQTENLASAYYWTYPPADSPAYHAFRAFRNYDNNGSRFPDYALKTESQKGTSLFAATDESRQRLVLVVLNLHAEKNKKAMIDIGTCDSTQVQRLFHYTDQTSGIAPVDLESVKKSGNKIKTNLPPYSITIIELNRTPGTQPSK